MVRNELRIELPAPLDGESPWEGHWASGPLMDPLAVALVRELEGRMGAALRRNARDPYALRGEWLSLLAGVQTALEGLLGIAGDPGATVHGQHIEEVGGYQFYLGLWHDVPVWVRLIWRTRLLGEPDQYDPVTTIFPHVDLGVYVRREDEQELLHRLKEGTAH